MIADIVTRLVDFARRHAVAVALSAVALSLLAGVYAAGHLAISTDVERMLPDGPKWRQDELELSRTFPQNQDLLAIVIDAPTPSLADQAARRLAERMRAEPQLFTYVRQPDGGPFFDQNGLLFLSTAQLSAVSQELVTAQPMLGSLAQDPSLRGLFHTLSMFIAAAAKGTVPVAKLNPTLAAITPVVLGVLDGKPEFLSLQQLMSGQKPGPRELRRFVLTRPVLDFSALEPGGKARSEVRRLAHELQLEPQSGVRLRMTGTVAIDDEQFAVLRAGAWRSIALSVVSVCVILFWALRSVRLVAAILGTLACGFALTAGFAALAIGSLNLISVAFGVLFIGLAVDFSIQFSIRYRDQRYRRGELTAALTGAARSIGPALVLAAGATAIGFLSFVPTQYVGVRELGWIAGSGMIIAIVLNFVLLPALLMLLRPPGEPEPIGLRRAARLDRFLIGQRQGVIVAAAALAVAGIALLPRTTFDFNPLNLQNPHNESVATAFDLMKDPTTTPYTAEILAPSLAAADDIAGRLAKLPEVAQVVTASTYIPSDQQNKLAIIGDLQLLLGPTLSPWQTLPPPSDAEVMKAIADCRTALQPLAAAGGPASPAAQLAQALGEAMSRGPGAIPALRQGLLASVAERLAVLRKLLEATPVTLETLPPELRDSWIAPDGRARIQAFPRGDARDNSVLEQFVAAVRSVAPEATGTPVTIQEAGRLISTAFVEAGAIAVAAITLLLALVLRRLREVALVIAPLLLAAVLTLAIAVVIGMPLNYANIIALPLLLGIGVAFDIYFVMNWRAGVTHHLQSSTARAVLFSALTTMTAFGSLALSSDPGTAEMGKLLAISLASTLFCTLTILPALLGPAPVPRPALREPPRGMAAIRPPVIDKRRDRYR